MAFRPALHPLCLGLLLAMAGCASQAPVADKAAPAALPRFAGKTLADLDAQADKLVITEGALPDATVEGALGSYRQALDLYNDTGAKSNTISRMADLTMTTAEQRLQRVDDDSTQQKEHQDKQAQLDRKIEANIDAMLFDRFMQGMATARTKEESAAYFDLASNLAETSPEAVNTKVDYSSAIKLYKELLSTAKDPKERADAYYKLAKAYELDGKPDEFRRTLHQLVKEYPDSTFFTEAHFRLGESYFGKNDYLSAQEAYRAVVTDYENYKPTSTTPNAFQAVLARGHSAAFYLDALYKLGWSEFKASDYDKATGTFFKVAREVESRMGASEAKDRNLGKLLKDTHHAIALCFLNQNGATSAQIWFGGHPAPDLEPDIYLALGQLYQTKRLYQSAADTYDTFVNTHPLHDRAPEFTSATIEAYREGGFPDLVLPAKERFIRHYGTAGKYWAQANEAQRGRLAPLLRQHMIDLAKHAHAQAQRQQADSEYTRAAGWYREYLAMGPEQTEALPVQRLLAEALFAGHQYEAAVVEFEKLAYSHPDAVQGADAGYMALVAYQSWQGTTPAEPADALSSLITRKHASTVRFAQTFPAFEKTPAILQAMTAEQLERKDIEGALKSAGLLIALNPPAPETMVLEAWMIVGNGEFDLGRPEVAELAYRKVLGFTLLSTKDRPVYQDRLAATIYKQAEKKRDAGDTDGAVTDLLRIAETGTTSKLLAAATFDAATLLFNAKQYERAIPILEGFRSSYPKHELTATIPDKLAIAYEQTGKFALAAREYEGIALANLKTQPELAREAMWQAAELQDKAQQPAESARLFERYLATFPKPIEPAAEAGYRLYRYALAQQDNGQRLRWLRELQKLQQTAGSDNTARTAYLGAMASFELAKPLSDDFIAIELKQPLNKSLPRKKDALKKALEAYTAIAAIGVAEYVTAANFQIAELYRKLGADLMASERPAGLSELELEQYTILLEEQAMPFENKAMGLYVANANLVKQNVYDDYVRKSFDALATLNPGRYNKREQDEPYVPVIY